MNSNLFPSLPVQRAPATICTDLHMLEVCQACGGTGEGTLHWPDIIDPCEACNGGGCVLRSVQEMPGGEGGG